MEWKYKQMMIDQGEEEFVKDWSDEKEILCRIINWKHDYLWNFVGDEVYIYDGLDSVNPIVKFSSVYNALDYFKKEENDMFRWDMTKDNFERIVSAYQEDNPNLVDEGIGQLRFGEICFDCIVREYDHQTLTMDMYVYNVDSGYAYAKDGTPYSYEGGFDFNGDLAYVYDLSFESFKLVAQAMAYRFAKDAGFEEKANKEYKEW